MDQFVTTYRKDYLWPYVKVLGTRPSPENIYPPLSTGDHGEMCPCTCMQNAKAITPNKVFGPNALKEESWSRGAPVGPLVDPKMYPAQVGRAPEVDTTRFNQHWFLIHPKDVHVINGRIHASSRNQHKISA